MKRAIASMAFVAVRVIQAPAWQPAGWFWVAVEAQFAQKRHLVSFVEVLTDGVFNTYRQRGVGGRVIVRGIAHGGAR